MKKKREQCGKLLQMLEDSDLTVSSIDEDRITIRCGKGNLVIMCQNDMFSIRKQYGKNQPNTPTAQKQHSKSSADSLLMNLVNLKML